MQKKIILLLSLLFVFFILIQCDKDAKNLVGAQFFERENMGDEKYLSVQAMASDTSYHQPKTIINPSFLYVGESGNTKTKSIILFSTSIPDSGQVDSARVSFNTHAPIGAEQGTFTMTVHLIATEFDWTQITWDEATNGFVGDQVATLEFDAAELAEDDTLNFSFLLPNNVVQAWMDTLQDVNYGLLFDYQQPGFIAQIYGAHVNNDTEIWPLLKLYYTENGTQYTSSITSSEDTYLAVSDQVPTTNELLIGNGTTYHSVLNFDVSPIAGDATINYAKLVMRCDTLLSFPSHQPYLVDAFLIENADDIFTTEAVDSITGLLLADSLTINIASFVQRWSTDEYENLGLFLKGYDSNHEIQQVTFFSSSALDTTMRPTLNIYYTLPPSGRL